MHLVAAKVVSLAGEFEQCFARTESKCGNDLGELIKRKLSNWTNTCSALPYAIILALAGTPLAFISGERRICDLGAVCPALVVASKRGRIRTAVSRSRIVD
jgi:hypothetical protein